MFSTTFRVLRKRLAWLCWRLAFRLAGVKPTALMDPGAVRRHEDLTLHRLALDLFGEGPPPRPEHTNCRCGEGELPAWLTRESLPMNLLKRERVPSAEDLDSWFRGMR